MKKGKYKKVVHTINVHPVWLEAALTKIVARTVEYEMLKRVVDAPKMQTALDATGKKNLQGPLAPPT